MTPKYAVALHSREREPGDPSEGWTWLRCGKRAHYFRDDVSLCRQFRIASDNTLTADYYGPENQECRVCMQRVQGKSGSQK